MQTLRMRRLAIVRRLESFGENILIDAENILIDAENILIDAENILIDAENILKQTLSKGFQMNDFFLLYRLGKGKKNGKGEDST